MSELEPTLSEDELHTEIKRTAAAIQRDTEHISADTRIDLLNGELLDDYYFPITAETYLPDEYISDWESIHQVSRTNPLASVQLKGNQKFYRWNRPSASGLDPEVLHTAVWRELDSTVTD